MVVNRSSIGWVNIRIPILFKYKGLSVLRGIGSGNRWTKLIIAFLIGLMTASGGWVPTPKAAAGSADTPIIGEIKLFPYTHPPLGWQRADGRILSIAGNDVLYNVIGTRFGGDGVSTFALPDLRGVATVSGVNYYIATQGLYPSSIPGDAVVVSELRIFAFDYAGNNLLPARHQSLPISSYAPLYALIGSLYGGNGTTTFNLPDLNPLIPGVSYYIAYSGLFPNSSYGGLPYFGEILTFPYGVNSSSVGVDPADGQLLNIQQNAALFALLGTRFGGNGVTQFAKPNMSGSTSILYGIARSGSYPPLDWDEIVAYPDSYSVYSNYSLTVTGNGILANDYNASSARLISGPQHGAVVLNSGGAFTYTSSGGFVGTDSFTYQALPEGNVATVTITVLPAVSPQVIFNSNGGTAVPSQTVNQGSAATKPADPTRTGYTFAGWYADSLFNTPFNFANAIMTDTNLYAKWTSNQYTVQFDTAGGSAVANQTVNYNGKATKPADPTKVGYTFAGWYADSALTVPYDFAATAITGVTTIYANWTINQYAVKFNTNGGSTIADQSIDYNAKATKPADPTKVGYTFEGWYADSALTTAYDFTATAIKGVTTIYANWTINQYAVKFNTNGGSTIADQSIDYNGKATKPVDPTKVGYTFEGWYEDSALTMAYDFTATAITGVTTIYANWTINQYAVKFNTNGGSAVADQTVNYNAKVTKPADPTKAGYTFADWYADSGLTTPFDFAATSITGAATIYAKWTPVPIVIVPQPGNEPDKDTIAINKFEVNMTLTHAETSDGRQTVSISLDEHSLTQALLQGKLQTTITVDLKEPVIQVELPVNALLALASQFPQAVITIERDGASYSLPVSVLRDAPKDASVIVLIGYASEQASRRAANAAAGLQAELLLDTPIEYTVTVNGKELNDFNGVYVDRTITLPGTADPRHTTVVWLDPQGKLQVVPATFSNDGARTVITIHAAHNSVYTVVHLDRTFADLQNHWAKSDVELLANRMIVNGVSANHFAPNSSITRAEFAALLVRALGLQETAPTQSYADVQQSDWFYGAVGAAQKAGLITGSGNGAFQPGAYITREQMVLMIARAIQYGGQGETAQANMAALDAFADRSAIADWAQEAAVQALDAGIIQGMTASTFAPKDTATRAQSAVMLKRLLQYLHFINE